VPCNPRSGRSATRGGWVDRAGLSEDGLADRLLSEGGLIDTLTSKDGPLEQLADVANTLSRLAPGMEALEPAISTLQDAVMALTMVSTREQYRRPDPAAGFRSHAALRLDRCARNASSRRRLTVRLEPVNPAS